MRICHPRLDSQDDLLVDARRANDSNEILFESLECPPAGEISKLESHVIIKIKHYDDRQHEVPVSGC